MSGGPIQLSSPRTLARALLLFWAIWFSIVLASNVADALAAAELVPASGRFASGNFALIAESISVYSASRAWAAVLFALVLALELAAAGLFWRAALEAKPARSRILPAFLAGIVLFCGFLVCDEFLLLYRRFPNLGTSHFVILCALLLSLSSIHLLDQR
jgi:hypothetical protein